MSHLKQKLLPLLLLLAVGFSFVPVCSYALTYQAGQVLGDSTYAFPTGSLVNQNGTIYFIYQQTKIPFTNWSAFVNLGYKSTNVKDGDLSNYTLSTDYVISTFQAAHPWGTWLLNQGTIYYSDPSGLIGVPDYQTFLDNGGDPNYVVPANSYDLDALQANPKLTPLMSHDPRLTGQTVVMTDPIPTTPPETTPTPDDSSTSTFLTIPSITPTPKQPVSALSGAVPSVWLDDPLNKITVSGNITVNGWAIANTSNIGTAISKVQLYIDGNYSQDIPYGTSRPDVCAAYPGRANCPNVGYQTTLDTSKLTNGSHTLRISANNSDPYSLVGYSQTVIILVNNSATTISPTPTPTPSITASETINTLDYFINTHNQTLTGSTGPLSQTVNGQTAYYVKWDSSYYETYAWDSNYIYLKEDHSGTDGSGAPGSYTFSDGKWLARTMQVGQKLAESSNAIQNFGSGCSMGTSGVFPYVTTLEQHISNYNLGGDLGTQDVIIVRYDYGSGSGTDFERSYYAKGWGWVKWELYRNGQVIQTSPFTQISTQAPTLPNLSLTCLNKIAIPSPTPVATPTPNANVPALPTTLSNFVSTLYSCVLNNNTPDSSGFNFWLNNLQTHALTIQGAYTQIFGYQSAVTPAINNDQFTQKLYGCILFRLADTTSYNNVMAGLNSGSLTQAGLVQTVLNSPEFTTNILPKLQTLIPSTPTTTPSPSVIPTPTPIVTIGLTATQTAAITKDLQTMKSMGFKRIRIITFTRTPQDTNYSTWPANVFITFPQPTDAELTDLKQYLQLVDQAGFTYEFVLVPADTKSQIYTAQSAQNYKNFIDAIWPVMWTGKLDSIEVGGDLSLNPTTIDTQNPNTAPTGQNVVNYDRQWLLDMWTYVNAKCPGCNIGTEVYTGYAKFWDLGATNLTWIKSNLNPGPKFVGLEYYPTTQTALTSLGFEQGTTINWTAAIQDWYQNLKAAAGNIPLIVDEMGLDLKLGFTEQDKVDFYQATASYLVQQGVHFNIWELYDHPWQQYGSSFGLLDINGNMHPAANTVQNILTPTLNTAFTAGIQYATPNTVGWQFIMPQN